MIRPIVLTVLLLYLVCHPVLAEETISAQEVDSYFYADGVMKRSTAQFEITYFVEGNTVTRRRVYDIKQKKVIPDSTIYTIQRQLLSDPSRGRGLPGRVVIRAIGQPGGDAIEILIIGDTFVHSVKSTSDYLVISRQKRIK